MTRYDDAMTLREARDHYFRDNGFGEDGGYGARWVDFKLGPLPMPFPNTKARVRAVRFHDLHHVLTGYRTDTLGEFEISAWELGAGCGSFFAAWQLNLGGTFAGAVLCPRRAFAAFVRGRRGRSLYHGLDYDELLARTVAEGKALVGSDEPAARPTAADAALFALASAAGLAVGTLSLGAFALMAPPLLALGLFARPAPAPAG